jgi:monomeric sarcosine oxidase
MGADEAFDVAVIGLGAAGSAALSALARAGVHAVGIDQYAPPHDQGSSHGETRLLRTAYSEGALYVPLIRRARLLWGALEKRSGARLFERSGVVYAGPRDDPFLVGAQAAAKRWRLRLSRFGGMDGRIQVPADWLTLKDAGGGYLYPERAIAALLRDATAHGATLRTNCRCTGIDRAGRTLVIRTQAGTLRADRAIVATGAWCNELLPALKTVTWVERRVLHWFADPDGRFRAAAGFLPFAVATGRAQLFYGFPANDSGEVKVAEHDTVQVIAGPAALDRRIGTRDTAAIAPLVKRFMPALGRRTRSAVCLYPMAKGERFILARHPADRRIVIGAGLSGHGFKFAPAIGEALANLALGRKQAVPIGAFALRMGRCGL